MLTFEDYVGRDLTGWGEAIRARAVSAPEVVEAAIARAEAVNPKVNAIAVPLFDRAREAAKAPVDGPFSGAPFAIKDLYQTIAGVPLTNGSRAYEGVVAERDSEAVRRFKAAGLIPIATTTSPELGIATATESTLYGITRNPWDLERTPGGSSGGSGALVAAGVVAAAHATDGGGSIRIPASCCGLFGLKPSRGRTPAAPNRTEGWLGLSTGHVVSRSVRDSAALLDALHGPDLGARYVAPPPRHGSFLDAVAREPGRLRIALHWRTVPGVEPDPVCVEAARDAAKLCESLGHEVEEAAPDLDLGALARAFGVVIVSAVALAAKARAEALGVSSVADRLEEVTRAQIELAARFTAADLMAANDAFQEAAIAVARFQEGYDLILTPTLGRPPLPVGAGGLLQPLESFTAATTPFSPFTATQNQTGQPAMSVPLFWSDENLPIGVQFAARLGEEETLFSLAAQLERARPWSHRIPAL